MPSLYVYTTEGTCIYPDGGSDDASINRYFESVNFVADLSDPNNPSIEAYFRAILPSGRPEQLFLRFQGDDPSSLFDDCRNAVLNELVAEQGWEIQETTSSGDPSMLFQRAVLRPPPDPSQVVENTPLAGRMERIRAAIHGTREPVTVTGRNYETIADAIRTFADEPAVMAVADGDISLSRVGLVFQQKTQQYALTLPRGTEQLLQQVSTEDVAARGVAAREQRATSDAQRIESELSEIETQLRAMQDKDVSEATVREQLDGVVSDVYPSLSVSAVRTGLSVGGAGDADDEEAGGAGALPSPPSSDDRFSGIVPNLPDRVAIAAGIGVIVVVLLAVAVVSGVNPLANGNGGSPEGGGFNVTSVEVLSDNVTAGDSFNVSVTIANNGDEEATMVTLDVGDLNLAGNDSKEAEFDGNDSAEVMFEVSTSASHEDEYTVTASAGDDTAEATVTVENASDGSSQDSDPDPAESSLSELDIAGEGDNATIEAGDAVNVSVDVKNVGDETGSFEVSLDVGDNITKTKNTTNISANTTGTVTFEDLDTNEPEDYPVNVATEDDEVSGMLEVDGADQGNLPLVINATESASFNVTIDNKTQDSVDAGKSMTVVLNFTEVGNDLGEISVAAEDDKISINPDDKDFTPDEDKPVGVNIALDTGVDDGEYTIRVRPDGDDEPMDTATVTVGEE